MVRLGLVVHQAKVIPRQFDPAWRGLGSELLELGEDGLYDPDHNCERWCRADVLNRHDDDMVGVGVQG